MYYAKVKTLFPAGALGAHLNGLLKTNAKKKKKISSEPPVLQAKHPQFPQQQLVVLVIQTLPELRCPSLDLLQHLNVFLAMRSPKLNSVQGAAVPVLSAGG